MIDAVKPLIAKEPMLLALKLPVTIVGDIHGQYKDLHRIFKICGQPEKHRYLFLGDYVDRGASSLECICCVFAYKLMYPEFFLLLRGNHETRTINRVYGFMQELTEKFGEV
jgi:serine/threonine-protein phosphatase PP1 catalytic subunit